MVGIEFKKNWKDDLVAATIWTDRSVSFLPLCLIAWVKEGQTDGIGSVWRVCAFHVLDCEVSEPSGERRVLDAARKLFSEQDYASVSISAIADEAGVSKANIYHHFRSKSQLYYQVLKLACADATQAMQWCSEEAGSCQEMLRSFVLRHLVNLLNNPTDSRLMIRELFEAGKNLHSELNSEEISAQEIDCNFARLVSLLREGQKSGEFRAELNPSVLAVLVVGANILFMKGSEVLSRLPDITYPKKPESFSAMVADVLLNGILNRPAVAGANSLEYGSRT